MPMAMAAPMAPRRLPMTARARCGLRVARVQAMMPAAQARPSPTAKRRKPRRSAVGRGTIVKTFSRKIEVPAPIGKESRARMKEAMRGGKCGARRIRYGRRKAGNCSVQGSASIQLLSYYFPTIQFPLTVILTALRSRAGSCQGRSAAGNAGGPGRWRVAWPGRRCGLGRR